MTAQTVGEPQRLFEVHPTTGVEAGRAPQRFRGHVEFERSFVERHHGETATADRNAVADRDIGEIQLMGVDAKPYPVSRRLLRNNVACRLDDAGEHQWCAVNGRRAVDALAQ
jgi:hypothetical protein